MAIALRQSTASQEVPLGYFVDSTDGNTEETALTIANTDIKIWKSGATTLADKNSGGATHISNGIYYAVLDATDTDTLGPLVIFVHESGALPVRLECVVLSAVNYDSAIAASDTLQVDVVQWLGTAAATPTVAGVPEVDLTHIAGAAVSTSTAQLGVNAVQAGGTAWGSGAITAGSIAADAITAAKIAPDAIGASELAADAFDELWDEALTDSVPADGALPTARQALYMITQFLYERSVSGTTVTVRKVDGTTALLTLTLNDGTTPTSITRAT